MLLAKKIHPSMNLCTSRYKKGRGSICSHFSKRLKPTTFQPNTGIFQSFQFPNFPLLYRMEEGKINILTLDNFLIYQNKVGMVALSCFNDMIHPDRKISVSFYSHFRTLSLAVIKTISLASLKQIYSKLRNGSSYQFD